MLLRKRLPYYAYLMRIDKPIGTLLLLWPTLWALWLASAGQVSTAILCVFLLGVFLMRSAGCIMNDLADREFDSHVKRTQHRPLVTQVITLKEAVYLLSILLSSAFLLVLTCNLFTIYLAFFALLFSAIYPFLKRFMPLPQFGLGLAFAWGIPMAFAAIQQHIPFAAWILFLAALIWSIIYDTMYAMVDREDDIKIGIHSAAILFNTMDKILISLLQLLFLTLLIIVGLFFHLHSMYYVMLVIVFFLFLYQQWLIKNRDEKKCFRAFLNNNWVGFFIFLGIFVSYI